MSGRSHLLSSPTTPTVLFLAGVANHIATLCTLFGNSR